MQALIFDFDGLILDTETPELEVWTQVFRDHGLEMPPGYWSSIIGRGAEQEVERPPKLLQRLRGDIAEPPEAQVERWRKIRERIELESARPGVEDLLREAKAAGLPLAVASSSKHEWVDLYLDKLGLRSYFSIVVCADDVERAKPFPDLYLAACDRLGVSPHAAVALEDSPNGVRAARAAGVFVVAIPNPVTVQLDLSEADARRDNLAGVTLAELEGLWKSRSLPI